MEPSARQYRPQRSKDSEEQEKNWIYRSGQNFEFDRIYKLLIQENQNE